MSIKPVQGSESKKQAPPPPPSPEKTKAIKAATTAAPDHLSKFTKK